MALVEWWDLIVNIQQSGGLLGGRRRRTATTIFRKAKNEARQHPFISAIRNAYSILDSPFRTDLIL